MRFPLVVLVAGASLLVQACDDGAISATRDPKSCESLLKLERGICLLEVDRQAEAWQLIEQLADAGDRDAMEFIVETTDRGTAKPATVEKVKRYAEQLSTN